MMMRLPARQIIRHWCRRSLARSQPHLLASRQNSAAIRYFTEGVSEQNEALRGVDAFKTDFTMEDLFNARCYMGHKERMLNEHMRPYIFGKRLGVLVIDLEHTARMLDKALRVTAEIAYRKGIILFVHGSRQNGWMVEKAAKECEEYAYCRRWRDDVLTNAQQVFGSVIRLPDLVIIFSTLDQANSQHRAVVTSAKMLIPTIGICDTNSNPTLVTYPVPGNDDTPESIELYCRLFKCAVLTGKARRKEIIEKYGEEFYNKTLESD